MKQKREFDASEPSTEETAFLQPKTPDKNSRRPINLRHIPFALAAGAALMYCVASILMNFINKLTLQVFGLANTLLILQNSAILLTVGCLRALAVVQFPPVNLQRACTLTPVTLLYVSNVAFALLGLQSLNIPMYNTLKRITPVIILFIKAVETRKAPPHDIAASVFLVVAGCIVAGIGDFSFDLKGYIFALTSCLLQASYLLLVERSGIDKGIGTTELLFYNALLSMPFLAVVVVLTGEFPNITLALSEAVDQMGSISLGVLLLVFSVFGMLLNYSMFLCAMLNSALTTTIIGVLKGAVATVLGFFFLGGVKFNAVNVLGIAINMVGGSWYSWAKYQARQQRMQNQQAAT